MKTLTSSLRHYVVQKLRLPKKEAVALILTGRVLVNGQKAELDRPLLPEDEVTLDGMRVKEAEQLHYLAYYKPRGIECTLSTTTPANLAQALDFPARVFPVGRLDKESEGLLLLTNDGAIFNRIIHSKHHQEKEYVVTVNKPLTGEALAAMAAGIEIMGQKTRPALTEQLNERTFRIVLTQGLNRQIRRMCYKLGYEVLELKRVRIITIELQGLAPGQWRHLTQAELEELRRAVCL